MKRTNCLLTLLIATIFFTTINAQEVDNGFTSKLERNTPADTYTNIEIQPDGKTLYFGYYRPESGEGNDLTGFVKRANLDGSLDTSFNCNSCDFAVQSVLVQPDGKVIIAGSSLSDSKMIRVNSDGTLDLTFNANFPLCFSCYSELYANDSNGRFYGGRHQAGQQFSQTTLYRCFSRASGPRRL